MVSWLSILLSVLMAYGGETITEESPTVPQAEKTSSWIRVEATAYTANCRGCIGITRDGTVADHRKMIIAADTKIFPLGAEVEIQFPDGSIRRYTVRDTSEAIRGNKIDILMGSYQEAILWGRRYVSIRAIRG